MSKSIIDENTVLAYLETDFIAYSEPPTVLRIGEVSGALAGLHKAHRVECSAFITACNPYSQRLSGVENTDRQTALSEELKLRGLTHIDGVGCHPAGLWPAEPSYLVFGLALEAAKILGTRLDQNAIVWSGPDSVPQLILLR